MIFFTAKRFFNQNCSFCQKLSFVKMTMNLNYVLLFYVLHLYDTYDLKVDEFIPDSLHGYVDRQSIAPREGCLNGILGCRKLYLPITIGFEQFDQAWSGRRTFLGHDAANSAPQVGWLHLQIEEG